MCPSWVCSEALSREALSLRLRLQCERGPRRFLGNDAVGEIWEAERAACGMEARRAETQAMPRLGSRQPFTAGARTKTTLA